MVCCAGSLTYIGAPLESKKRGYHVSGVPGVPFVFFLLAGFFSPDKWLMLIALLDFSLTYLPVFLLKEHLKKGKSERESNEIYMRSEERERGE